MQNLGLVVFDLDGTLALNEHRQHFVARPKGEKKDWTGFFDACDLDEPNEPVILLLNHLHNLGHRVEIWSGRTDSVKEKTFFWLGENNVSYVPIKMRKGNDNTPDVELKKQWLDECDEKPIMCFDDRDSVVAMWRANDIVCLQVAPGNF